MVKGMRKVTVILLGSFAGNNAGDMVVLESIINDFNHLILAETPEKEESIFAGMEHVSEIELIVPILDKKGLEYIENTTGIEKGLVICPIPINKNLAVATKAVLKLIKEFSKADYIYTTAGILFDQKIWNPFYNFVMVYTPLLRWAKFTNPRVKIIGYNVGITSSSKIFGKHLLKKCIALHNRIYLREERDAVLLEKFRYKGDIFISTDNVFGYDKPQMPQKHKHNKIYINLTPYGIENTTYFVREIVRFVCRIKNEYQVYFFQTSKRDLEIARTVCEKAHLGEDCIYDLRLMGYRNIENLLSECDVLIGMRMHSLIFALKGGCPIIAMNYSPKVASMMQDIRMEKFLIDIDGVSEIALLDKMTEILEQKEKVVHQIYAELERRYVLCNRYK